MINARLCKKLSLAFFFASLGDCVFSVASSRHSDFSCSDVFSKSKQTNQDSEKENVTVRRMLLLKNKIVRPLKFNKIFTRPRFLKNHLPPLNFNVMTEVTF